MTPVPDLSRPAPEVAPLLIGCRLAAGRVIGRITEVEAYHGEDDRACHAHRGRTPRSAGLYAAPGTLYVYLCYGMHHLLNLVCDEPSIPSAVLIRGLIITHGLDEARRRRGQPKAAAARLTNGPGKVAQALGLDKTAHATRLGQRGCPLRLLPGDGPSPRLLCGPRIGVDYAGPHWATMPWRWWEEGYAAVREAGARQTTA